MAGVNEDKVTLGRDFMRRVSETLNLKFITDAKLKTGVETNAELTITILLTEEQESKILGKE